MKRYLLPESMTASQFAPVAPIETNQETSRFLCNFCHFKDITAKVVALHRELYDHQERPPTRVKREPGIGDEEVIIIEDRWPTQAPLSKILPKKESGKGEEPLLENETTVVNKIRLKCRVCPFITSEEKLMVDHLMSQHVENGFQVLIIHFP